MKVTIDDLAREARSAYWTALGKPKRAKKDPSPESHEAWRRTVGLVVLRAAEGESRHRGTT